jgi:hypothetical protein
VFPPPPQVNRNNNAGDDDSKGSESKGEKGKVVKPKSAKSSPRRAKNPKHGDDDDLGTPKGTQGAGVAQPKVPQVLLDEEAFEAKLKTPIEHPIPDYEGSPFGAILPWQSIAHVYTGLTIKPPFDIIHRHPEYEILKEFCTSRRSQTFTYMMEGRKIYYPVSAQAMVQLIVMDRHKVITRQLGQTEARFLVPVSWNDVRRSEIELRYIAVNQDSHKFMRYYGWKPYQHDVYMMFIHEEMSWCFSPATFEPGFPLQDSWRAFKFGLSNIRYNGKTYAANCRHPTSAWNEHPWCEKCLAIAGIHVCRDLGEHCDHCANMTSAQVDKFHKMVEEAREAQKKAVAVGTQLAIQSKKLPSYIREQLHADRACKGEVRDKDHNPAWSEGKLGLCRPSYAIPYYWTKLEVIDPANKVTEAGEAVLEHEEVLQDTYHLISRKNPPGVWADLQNLPARDKVLRQSESDEKPAPPPPETKAGPRRSNRDKRPTKPQEPQRRKSRKQDLPQKSPGKDSDAKPADTSQDLDDAVAQQPVKQAALQADRVARSLQLNIPDRSEPCLAVPIGFRSWSANSYQVHIPGSDPEQSYMNYNAALAAAARMSSDVQGRVLTLANQRSGQKLSRSIIQHKRVTFTPSTRYMAHADLILMGYAKSPDVPALPELLPVNMYEFPKQGIDQTVGAQIGDRNGKFPSEADTLCVSQREVVNLDANNRALLKLHETDDVLMEALVDKLMELNLNRSQAEQQEKPFSDEVLVLDALRHNMMRREVLLGRQEGLITAVRRRDFAQRYNLTVGAACKVISAPLQDSVRLEEEPGRSPGSPQVGSAEYYKRKQSLEDVLVSKRTKYSESGEEADPAHQAGPSSAPHMAPRGQSASGGGASASWGGWFDPTGQLSSALFPPPLPSEAGDSVHLQTGTAGVKRPHPDLNQQSDDEEA